MASVGGTSRGRSSIYVSRRAWEQCIAVYQYSKCSLRLRLRLGLNDPRIHGRFRRQEACPDVQYAQQPDLLLGTARVLVSYSPVGLRAVVEHSRGRQCRAPET